MVELPGPVGERNLYALRPRRSILVLPETREGLIAQLAAGLATGNHVVAGGASTLLMDLPKGIAARVRWTDDWIDDQRAGANYAVALIEGDAARVCSLNQVIAALSGPIVLSQAGSAGYRLDWMVEEVSTSINTTAAGGNASLMAIV